MIIFETVEISRLTNPCLLSLISAFLGESLPLWLLTCSRLHFQSAESGSQELFS